MEKFFKYAWVLVGIVVLTFVYSNQADKNNKKVLDSIAEYEYCLSGSNKIFINDEYKEMTDADMITGTSANRNNLVFAGQYRTTA